MKPMRTSIFLFGSCGLAQTALASTVNDTCAAGLYIISVRATYEPPGIGIAGSSIGSKIVDSIPGSQVVALDYPATALDPFYPDSVTAGIVNLKSVLGQYQQTCPNSKIAIIGYSQGAQVTLDTLCGTNDDASISEDPIAQELVTKNVVAVTLFGDPTYNASSLVKFYRGTSSHQGVLARNNTENCRPFTNLLASYCDNGDRYCSSGNNQAVHGGYFTKYSLNAAQFILDKYNDNSASSFTLKATPSSASTTNTGNRSFMSRYLVPIMLLAAAKNVF